MFPFELKWQTLSLKYYYIKTIGAQVTTEMNMKKTACPVLLRRGFNG
jgi:hypothetical protein